MSEPTHIKLSKIVDFNQPLENGTHSVKIINIESSDDNSMYPYIDVTFEVIEGAFEGQTHRERYFLTTRQAKDGSHYCIGVSILKRAAEELGVLEKLPDDFPLDPAKARLALAKAFTPKLRFHILIKDGKPNKEGKVYKKTEIIADSISQDDETEQAYY